MTPEPIDSRRLLGFVGNTRRSKDTFDQHHANLMEATLDRPAALKLGDKLPATWHWAWFAEAEQQSQLGRDGHPERSSFLPPVPLPRRMWAGNRLRVERPFHVGETVERRSTIKKLDLKEGRNGPLCFVTVLHDYYDKDGSLCLSEEHDTVYRDDPSTDESSPEPAPPETEGQLERVVTPTPTLLFRYSALTFNTHRIHYDRDYCREIERYPGLVFHGPLVATLLADVAQSGGSPPIRSLNFRASAPLYDTDPFEIRSNGDGTFWAQGPQGGVATRLVVER